MLSSPVFSNAQRRVASAVRVRLVDGDRPRFQRPGRAHPSLASLSSNMFGLAWLPVSLKTTQLTQ